MCMEMTGRIRKYLADLFHRLAKLNYGEKNSVDDLIYQLNITLRGSKPSI